jgi:hypothetical protein
MAEKSKPSTSNITRKEYMTLKSLKDKKEIRILLGDKENCIAVLNESTYKMISNLLESGVYNILSKDSTSQTKKKIWKLLTIYKTFLPVALKQTDSLPQ